MYDMSEASCFLHLQARKWGSTPFCLLDKAGLRKKAILLKVLYFCSCFDNYYGKRQCRRRPATASRWRAFVLIKIDVREMHDISSSSPARVELVSPFRPQTSSHRAVFFLVFLDYLFLSVGNRHCLEIFLMASSVDVPANLASFRAFPTFSFLVVTHFYVFKHIKTDGVSSSTVSKLQAVHCSYA
jgi:hypothetical protein